MIRRRGAQHASRTSALAAWIGTSAFFVAGFALGLGAHQAVTSTGSRRVVFMTIAVTGAAVLAALARRLRRDRPGAHAVDGRRP